MWSPASAAAVTASASLPSSSSSSSSSPPLGMAVMPAKPLPGTLRQAAIAAGSGSGPASGSTAADPRCSSAAVLGAPKHDSAAGPVLTRMAKAKNEGAPKVAVRAGTSLNDIAKQEEGAGVALAAEAKEAVEEAACTEALGIAIAGISSAILHVHLLA